ncbi:MAG: type II secretion system protein [Roseibacillus sp.]
MKRGFTLPEMLIVFGIITVLGAVLFPVTRGVIMKSQKVRCQSNLREIGFALDLACKDNNGRLPDLMSMRSSRNSDVPVLETVLRKYISNPEVFRCPADKEFFKKSGSSYAWNNVVSDTPREAMNFFGGNQASKIPLVGDKEDFHGEENGTNLLYGDFRTADEVKFSVGGGALGHAK